MANTVRGAGRYWAAVQMPPPSPTTGCSRLGLLDDARVLPRHNPHCATSASARGGRAGVFCRTTGTDGDRDGRGCRLVSTGIEASGLPAVAVEADVVAAGTAATWRVSRILCGTGASGGCGTTRNGEAVPGVAARRSAD